MANNIKLWTDTYGNNNGKAIILIAGAMAPAVFWTIDFCKELSSLNYFVIRYDNRDIGFSTHFEPCRSNDVRMPYSINDMVEDVNAILEYYNIKKSIVVGHSLGCSIAQLFCIKYPNKVEQMVLISSPIIATGNNKYVATNENVQKEMWSILMSNKMFQDYERGKDEFFRAWKYLNGKWSLDEDMATEYTKRLYETEYIEPAFNHTKVQENIPDIYLQLNNLNINKHFIYGEIDYLPANPNNIKTLVESLNKADLTIIKGAGHMFFNKEIWEIIFNKFKEYVV